MIVPWSTTSTPGSPGAFCPAAGTLHACVYLEWWLTDVADSFFSCYLICCDDGRDWASRGPWVDKLTPQYDTRAQSEWRIQQAPPLNTIDCVLSHTWTHFYKNAQLNCISDSAFCCFSFKMPAAGEKCRPTNVTADKLVTCSHSSCHYKQLHIDRRQQVAALWSQHRCVTYRAPRSPTSTTSCITAEHGKGIYMYRNFMYRNFILMLMFSVEIRFIQWFFYMLEVSHSNNMNEFQLNFKETF